MSALGQKQTCAAHKPMSAKCQKRALGGANLCAVEDISRSKTFATARLHQSYIEVFCFPVFWNEGKVVPWLYGYTRMTGQFQDHLYFRHTYEPPYGVRFWHKADIPSCTAHVCF
jgi:hypothetical protein